MKLLLDTDLEHFCSSLVPEGPPSISQVLYKVKGRFPGLAVNQLYQDLPLGTGELLELGRELLFDIVLNEMVPV